MRKSCITRITFDGLFFNELIQYAPLDLLCEKMQNHKDYIWMACFFHELIKHAHSNVLWVTNIAFEGLFYFMNWFNISTQITFLRKIASQVLHLKGFFPSWTDSICPLKFSFWEKLASQFFFEGLYSFMNRFNMVFKCLFWEKLASQRSHWNGFFSLLTDSVYQFRDCFWKKPSSISVFSVILWTWVNEWDLSLYKITCVFLLK